ncbi:MAG TPA: DEAD/DEAH box helicase family protein, partial [Candidatus Nanoarchaeia archaeon]|nr:DEAD/DEAH box helicase family protein [Candidatus Nanoarchaeia archaeon]
MAWNLYEKGKFLEPLKFSNGKTQEDIVKEVLNSIKNGEKIIFIHGVCGTGKSAIALNLAKELGKSSIVVPIKNLQMQYKKDYESEKYLLKNNGEKLKISVIIGRQNHKCKFLEENKNAIPKIKKEVNAKLHDIFFGKKDEIEKDFGEDESADNKYLPCKIEIKEKNIHKIKKYLAQNNDINIKNFSQLKDVKRVSVAGACPYWSPALPARYELGGKSFANSKKRRYTGLKDTEFIFYQRESGCKFYEQFNFYIDSDAIIFNSEKYKIESSLNRKPMTEVEIIDECDEFLDKFSNNRTINLDRMQNSLNQIFEIDESGERILKELREIIKKLKTDKSTENAVKSEQILSLRQTAVYDLFKILLKNPDFIYQIDDENYLFEVYESAKMFEEFLDESYVTLTKKDEAVTAHIVTINLAKKFKEMTDKNKIIVLMSGTLHSEEVLKDIFGIEKFKIIEAETQQQGQITIKRTGLEMDCKYSNFSTGKNNHKDYFLALDKCIEISKKPVLVHVNSFADLPSEIEKKEFDLKNLIGRERLKEIQDEDKEGKLIEEFKTGKINILFSTRASRGIDFPG